MEKICNVCKQSKPLDAFSIMSKAKDGRQSKCKSCTSIYMRDRLANPEKNKEINEKRRIFLKENAERLKADQKISYEKNREKRLAYQKRRMEDPVTRAETYKKRLAWKYKKLKTDKFFHLKFSVSSLIRVGLFNRGYGKKTRTATILGCTWEEFHLHIERQFQKCMTWENRDLWHIDHIIPLATAACEDDIIRLNHFTNLRPLWAEENQRKSARLEHLL